MSGPTLVPLNARVRRYPCVPPLHEHTGGGRGRPVDLSERYGKSGNRATHVSFPLFSIVVIFSILFCLPLRQTYRYSLLSRIY